MATGLLGMAVALAVVGIVIASVLWRGLPAKRPRDWVAIVLCGLIGAGVSTAWAAYIINSLRDRQIPASAWTATAVMASLVLLWGRREASRELSRRVRATS